MGQEIGSVNADGKTLSPEKQLNSEAVCAE
jgi:hypothetical protein